MGAHPHPVHPGPDQQPVELPLYRIDRPVEIIYRKSIWISPIDCPPWVSRLRWSGQWTSSDCLAHHYQLSVGVELLAQVLVRSIRQTQRAMSGGVVPGRFAPDIHPVVVHEFRTDSAKLSNPASRLRQQECQRVLGMVSGLPQGGSYFVGPNRNGIGTRISQIAMAQVGHFMPVLPAQPPVEGVDHLEVAPLAAVREWPPTVLIGQGIDIGEHDLSVERDSLEVCGESPDRGVVARLRRPIDFPAVAPGLIGIELIHHLTGVQNNHRGQWAPHGAHR